MKYLLLILCLFCAGCSDFDVSGPHTSGRSYHTERPVCNLPLSLRQHNWLSPNREGSCTHATVTTALRWSNRPETADWWRTHHSGGEFPESLAAKLDAAGIRYAMTVNANDVAFLEYAIESRRGCLVTIMGGRHAVFLADLTDTEAAIIDNNSPDVIQWWDRATFLTEWQNSNSWAIAVLYSPVPSL